MLLEVRWHWSDPEPVFGANPLLTPATSFVSHASNTGPGLTNMGTGPRHEGPGETELRRGLEGGAGVGSG